MMPMPAGLIWNNIARLPALLTSAWFENQIFMKAIRSRREQLRPVTQTMGPLTLTRSSVTMAAKAIAKPESALEKATESRGLLAEQHNEADLYGYADETILAELDPYVPAIQQGKGSAQLLHAGQ